MQLAGSCLATPALGPPPGLTRAEQGCLIQDGAGGQAGR